MQELQSSSPPPPPPSIRILDVPVHDLTYAEALERIAGMIAARTPHHLATVNPEFLVMARTNPPFKAVLQGVDLAFRDGVGLQVGAWVQRRRFQSRVTGVDLILRLAPLAAAADWRIFFLGAAPGVAARAAAVLTARYPTLQIETNPADPTPEATAAALDHIRATQPHILCVAYGAPTQDMWIAEHGPTLGVPVMMGVGGAFDFIAGITPRAPRLWRRLGIEWLYRLWKQPWRWRRQLRIPYFVWLVVVAEVRQLFQGGAAGQRGGV